MAQSYLGEIKNKPICAYGAISTPQAAAVDLTKGNLVYQDAALGAKVVPTASPPAASRIGVIENDSKNATGVLGDKSVEIYKHGAIAVIKLQGNMTIGGKGKSSTTTAGSGAELADPADSALNATFSDTEVEAELDAQRDFNKFYLFDYLGHPDEYLNATKQVTAAIDGEEIVVAFK